MKNSITKLANSEALFSKSRLNRVRILATAVAITGLLAGCGGGGGELA